MSQDPIVIRMFMFESPVAQTLLLLVSVLALYRPVMALIKKLPFL